MHSGPCRNVQHEYPIQPLTHRTVRHGIWPHIRHTQRPLYHVGYYVKHMVRMFDMLECLTYVGMFELLVCSVSGHGPVYHFPPTYLFPAGLHIPSPTSDLGLAKHWTKPWESFAHLSFPSGIKTSNLDLQWFQDFQLGEESSRNTRPPSLLRDLGKTLSQDLHSLIGFGN